MAVVITGTEIQFPSNGYLAGYYTGSSGTNTTYPLGQYLLAFDRGVAGITYTANGTVPAYTFTTGADICISGSSFAGGVALAGTWRFRSTSSLYGEYLIQRTA